MVKQVNRKDVVIFGASGFTGERVVRRCLQKQQTDPTFSFVLAGRSIPKLKEVLERAKKIQGLKEFEVQLIEADVKSQESIRDMCLSGKIVINCVGPYRKFGETVVRTAIECGTHYVDISGEPHFLESMQLKYDELAKQKKVYVVSACGFDSIPSEMGIAFTKKEFPGELNSVESYLKVNTGPKGTVVHYATWESAVLGISTAHELGPVRKQLYKTRTPRPSHKVEQKNLHYSEEAEGYAVPFPGADRSVARRTEYLDFTEQNKKPIQVVSYFNVGSAWNAFKLSFFGAIFMFMAKFGFTRRLLLDHPEFFSRGVFSHEGPTEEQVAATTFQTKFVGHGWPTRTSAGEVHTEPPTATIVTSFSGPEPGYIATSAFVLESALVILDEAGQPQPKIPRFGVLTPGYAFENTDIYQRLAPYGVKFEVLSRS